MKEFSYISDSDSCDSESIYSNKRTCHDDNYTSSSVTDTTEVTLLDDNR